MVTSSSSRLSERLCNEEVLCSSVGTGLVHRNWSSIEDCQLRMSGVEEME